MPSPIDPPNVWVARNQWTDLPVPDLGEWDPTRSISLVLPYYERSRELNLTLAALAEQSYPDHLLQVIVADDGSSVDPPNPPNGLPFEFLIVRQEDLGYGLARARNMGARAADGDVLLFLDCDMIPERQHVEAHARWHHAARRLVTVGFRFHADFRDASPEAVASAVRGGEIEQIAGSPVERPEWIEGHMRRTSDLLGPFDDLYLMMSGGNLAIDRDLYWEAGGNDESFTRWGGEDNEFGYRVMQLGAVVVPERNAIAWHQGEGQVPSSDELQSIWLQRAKLRNLIANPETRRPTRGRIHSVPRLLVSVKTTEAGAEHIGATVDALLASDFTDLVVGIEDVDDPLASTWLAEQYLSDCRVLFPVSQSTLAERFPFTPIRMSIPAGYGLDANTVGLLVRELGAAGVGALHVTLPGRPAKDGAELVLTRAWNRAQHLEKDSVNSAVGELFGERWVSGQAYGFWPIDDVENALVRIRQTVSSTSESSLLSEIQLKEAELTELKSRRALRVANSLGQLRRARSWHELRAAIAGLRRAFV